MTPLTGGGGRRIESKGVLASYVAASPDEKTGCGCGDSSPKKEGEERWTNEPNKISKKTRAVPLVCTVSTCPQAYAGFAGGRGKENKKKQQSKGY